jgi:hypothetical protein
MMGRPRRTTANDDQGPILEQLPETMNESPEARPTAGATGLQVLRLKLQLEAREEGALPPFLGSTLRGGLAWAMREACCATPAAPDCQGCQVAPRCLYAQLFEPQAGGGDRWLDGVRDAARPYVVEPPLGRTPDGRWWEFRRGAPLSFDLLLVGPAVYAVPALLAGIRTMADRGLGARRHGFRLAGAAIEEPLGSGRSVAILDPVTGRFCRDFSPSLLSLDVSPSVTPNTTESITLTCLTPLRLVVDGRPLRGPGLPFHSLIAALLRRLSSLAAFHGPGPLDVDFRTLVQQAREIETVATDLRYCDWSRESSRQGQDVALGGLLGSVSWRGPLAPYRWLLDAGEQLHVGKGAVFGLGRYRLD